jgi:coupling of ubiquitin conjugation to ER degradation protein 1
MAEQTLNIPQLIVFIIVSVLAIRWYLAKPAAAGTRPATANRAVRINPAHIDQIASMFPQLNRREIAWDLQRNGGIVAATTERVLSGRGLDAVSLPFYYTNFAVLRRGT